MTHLVKLVSVGVWVAGVVLAQGFWSTLFSIFVPFYAWYLVVERAMKMAGFI